MDYDAYEPDPPKSLARRLFRWTALTAVGLVLLSIAAVTSLRWVNPPTSAFMLRYALTHDAAPQHAWTDWSDISAHAALAVVAAEDQKFPTHNGFDVGAIEDAVRERRDGGRTRGASTISQQVAKNLFLWPGRNWLRKGLEVILTLEIELLWPKQRILEVYLNIAEFGPGMYGVGAASHRFFGKSPDALTPMDAALLAAVLPSPSRLNAGAPSAYLRERQQWILSQMNGLGTAYIANLK